MIKYEITFIVEENGTADAVLKLLEGSSIKPLKTTDCAVREFAYPIKKAGRGRYFNILIEAEPENIAKLEEQLKLELSVLRHLIVKALRTPLPLPPAKKPAAKTEEKPPVEKVAPEPPQIKPEVKEEKAGAKAEAKKEVKPAEKPKAAPKKPEAKKALRKTAKPKVEIEAKEEKEAKPEVEIAKDILDEKLKDLVED
ncbi:MAG: 30S ribosomal protein S6 [Candidatus Berkelbacteria bacterium]|nr:30S ribosomal protein S6 [Candidatus Berkelbacteria bacterium]